jgi:hypothetical protein
MSKSLNGSGSLNLTLNELRLLEIKATKVTGTDVVSLSSLTGNNATFLGTVDIGNMNISGTFGVQNLTVNGPTSIKAVDDTDDNDNKIAFIQGGTDTGILKTSTGLYYNPNSDTLTVGNLTGNVTGDVTGNLTGDVTATTITSSSTITANGNIVTSSLPIDNTDDNYRYIPFQGVGNILHKDTKLVFNPSNDTFETFNLICQAITTTHITATGNTSIKALNNTTANFNNRIPFINGDTTETGVLVSRGNFNYNTSSQTLNCGTFNGTLNGSVSNAVTIGTQDITASGTITINSKDTTATTELCRLLFLDGASNIGTIYDIVRATPLYYIPSSAMLVSDSVRGQVQLISPPLVLLGSTLGSTNASIGLYNDSGTVRNRYQHAGGHLFMDGNAVNSNNLIMTNTTQTRIYNELQCDDDVTITGTLTAGTLNIGTQSATNFSVTNNLTVGGDTILTNTPTASGVTPLSILLLGSNTLQRGAITFNPLSNILTTTNIGLTGSLSSSVLTTTTLSATTLNLSGDLTLTNLPTTVTSRVSYSLLYKNNTTDEVHETSPSQISIGRGLTDVFIKTERIIADTFQCVNGLPINYTCTYNCFDWRTFNHSLSNPHGTFGVDYYVELHTTNTGGHNPTVTQHGANIFIGTNPIIRSAFNFGQIGSTAHWNLSSNAYAGIWRVRVSCVFQNLTPHRQTPKIYLKKYTGTVWIEQPHISTAIDYARHDVGELVTLNLEGVVYLSSDSELVRIYTLLETHEVGNPPTWPDSITDWAGRDINIQMEFLGTGTATTGEIVNAL